MTWFVEVVPTQVTVKQLWRRPEPLRHGGLNHCATAAWTNAPRRPEPLRHGGLNHCATATWTTAPRRPEPLRHGGLNHCATTISRKLLPNILSMFVISWSLPNIFQEQSSQFTVFFYRSFALLLCLFSQLEESMKLVMIALSGHVQPKAHFY